MTYRLIAFETCHKSVLEGDISLDGNPAMSSENYQERRGAKTLRRRFRLGDIYLLERHVQSLNYGILLQFPATQIICQ